MCKHILSFLMAITAMVCHAMIQGSTLPPNISGYPDQIQYHSTPQIGGHMHHNNDPPDHFSNGNRRQFRALEPDHELAELEAELRARQLAEDPAVSRLMKNVALYSDESRQWAIEQLRMRLAWESAEAKRSGSVFRPLAPVQWLNQGDLHLYNQVDGLPWRIPMNALTKGMILTGPQGGGKTRFLISLCRQLSTFSPSIPFFCLDPKQELREWADYLNAVYVDVDDISLDLSPPPGLSYEQFLRSLMPQLGDTVGLIYGIEILQEAAQMCIDLRHRHNQQTGLNTEISLYDVYKAVPHVEGTARGKRLQYREAVITSIGRILKGSGTLFQCRKGIDLATLFNSNVILGCRSITDNFASKFLALHILYWLYESERFEKATDQLKRVLILDDATQFVSVRPGFDAASSTSPFTHIFSRLRSSGNGVITTSQIPHLADPGILALSHTILCIGGLHYGKDTKVLAEMMGLNEEQALGLSKLDKREALGICYAGATPGFLCHGRTLDVSDAERGS